MFKVLSHKGNTNQNNAKVPTCTKMAARSKTQVIVQAGEDVEQGKHSSIADVSGNLCSHYMREH